MLMLIQFFTFCSTDEKPFEHPISKQVNFFDKIHIENAPLDEQLQYRKYHLLKLVSRLFKNIT